MADMDLKCPSCGRQYPQTTNGPHFFAKHVATCKGPMATVSPRARATATASAKNPTPRGKKKRDYRAERERRKQRASGVAIRSKQRVENGPPRQVMGVSPRQIIAACEAEIAKLQALKTAAEALA